MRKIRTVHLELNKLMIKQAVQKMLQENSDLAISSGLNGLSASIVIQNESLLASAVIRIIIALFK